jgi:radical SAM protein with 4Fe4S-binding SPASM domain
LIQNSKEKWADYLIFRYKLRIYPKLERTTDFPIHLLIEPVSFCNLKCVMCFQSDPTFTKPPYIGQMDIKLFKKVIDEAVKEKCQAITMASRGEPLLHSNIEEILKYTKGKFFDIKLNTNATRLDEKKCHIILQNGVTELVFSVDSADKEQYEKIRRNAKFEKVVENIKRFHEIRKEYPDSMCKTRISGVKYDGLDVEKFVSFWEEIVDNVAYIKMQNRWDTYQNSILNMQSNCEMLWQRIYIWFDGVVNPCDYDYKSSLSPGNVNDSSIKEIWQGKKMSELRRIHQNKLRKNITPCDRCEV